MGLLRDGGTLELVAGILVGLGLRLRACVVGEVKARTDMSKVEGLLHGPGMEGELLA